MIENQNEKQIFKPIYKNLIYFLGVIYFLFIIPFNLPTFFPMFIDSGTYSYVAQEINRGKLLYKEVFEIKFPAIYYIILCPYF